MFTTGAPLRILEFQPLFETTGRAAVLGENHSKRAVRSGNFRKSLKDLHDFFSSVSKGNGHHRVHSMSNFYSHVFVLLDDPISHTEIILSLTKLSSSSFGGGFVIPIFVLKLFSSFFPCLETLTSACD